MTRVWTERMASQIVEWLPVTQRALHLSPLMMSSVNVGQTLKALLAISASLCFGTCHQITLGGVPAVNAILKVP